MDNNNDKDKIYSPESIEDPKYRDLFEEIKKCGKRKWITSAGKKVPHPKHLAASAYLRLDFTHLFNFLEIKIGEDLTDFQSEINNYGIQWDTFRQGQYRNIKADKVGRGICATAKFTKTSLISLLAQFLEDCENKNIRLYSYAEYEEIIKHFLQDAPQLVAQFQSKLSHLSKNSNQERSSEQTSSKSRYRIERVKDVTKWLDPYNFDEIPLVGREKEFELLDKFIEAEGQFKIWAIAGPSGAGKTRLAIQWALNTSVLKGWDCRVLHKDDRSETQWDHWLSGMPTLIIIDYMYGFEEVISKLMKYRFEQTKSKIRLLLIDHVFSECLHNDKRWGFTGDAPSFNRNEYYFFKTKPLDLRKTHNQEAIIKSIIAHRAGIDIESDLVVKANKYLFNTKGAYHPLFAALVSDAIKSGHDFTKWNRRELIDYYLSGNDRLPWKHENSTGRWASYFVAVATVRRGIIYRDLIKATENCAAAPEHFDAVKEICQRIITDENDRYLIPFEPDILGESFFLKLLQFIEGSNKFPEEFRQVFMAGNSDRQAKDAIEFIAFIQRLTRNLLNDDQTQDDTRALWDALIEFMSSTDFEDAEPLKWGLTAGLIDIVDAIKDQFSEEEIISLLKKIDPNVLYRDNNEGSLRESVVCSMRYFELVNKFTGIPCKPSEEMLSLFDRFTASKAPIETPFLIASLYGFNNTIHLLMGDVNIIDEKSFVSGSTSLMAASLGGHHEVVRYLLNAKADIHAVDIWGYTALIWASSKNHTETVKLLLEKGANIHATDNNGFTSFIWASTHGNCEMVSLLLNQGANILSADKEGRTALIWASFNGKIEMVRFLLSKGANLHAVDKKGSSAFIYACMAGHIEIVRLLLDEGAQITDLDNEGHTGLSWASFNDHIEVITLLISQGANINTRDNEGRTALMNSCIRGHIETVKLLLDMEAEINMATIEGRTALSWASVFGHFETVRLLLEKGAKIDITNNEGHTALTWASINGHIQTVKLLLEGGADIDIVDKNGFTVLSMVSFKGEIETVRLLLDREANIHTTDNKGRTALTWASINNQIETVRLLLDTGAEIDAADNEGTTALMWSSIKNHIEAVGLLLDKGAKIDIADNLGRTALICAKNNGHTDVAKLLLDKGASTAI